MLILLIYMFNFAHMISFQISKFFSENFLQNTRVAIKKHPNLDNDELKEIEEKVLSAADNANALEDKIFAHLKEMCFAELAYLQRTARAIACLDAILSFANVNASVSLSKQINLFGKKNETIELKFLTKTFENNNTTLKVKLTLYGTSEKQFVEV